MPRYHFHSADGTIDVDHEGMELPDIQAARLLGAKYAGDLLKNEPDQLWEAGQWQITVTNDVHEQLFTIVSLVINARPPARKTLTTS